jgi:disease resistance protein RPM1
MADALFVVLRKVALSLGEGALEKIGTEVVEAASISTDFEHSMKQIEGELLILQAFIAQVGPRKISDKTFDAWLDQVRDVAHEIEDIIDEYAYLSVKPVDTSSFFKRKFNQIKNFSAWQKLPSQISQVEARILRLAEMRNRYGISVGELDTTNKSHHSNHQLLMSESAYLTDNSEIVGNADQIRRLTQWLLEDTPDQTLIAILGMGGLGKTTIASSVYKNQKIRKSFDCHVWVAVSRTYHVEELLKEIINQLVDQGASIASGCMTMSRMRLVEVIQSYLLERKYMIVLDDVWDKDAWFFLDYAFVRNKCGSRVLITTRRKDVSSLAVDGYVIELKTLKHAESWELFCKKVFRASKNNICPDLRFWAEKIVTKCQGLPLAIVTIGSLLSYRELKEQDWNFFYDQFSWQLANNPELSWISGVLNMSLHDLPSYLRSCFLYCSLYPEDYIIRRKMISKIWIAEGLVEERGDGTTMEEVAENYLTELTQRSLLQVIERSACGRARAFLMHDLVREVTLTIAKKEKFGISYGNASIIQVTDEARRVSIQKGAQYFNSIASSRLRSFILFDTEVPSSLIYDALSRFRLLRVLCLRFANIEQVPSMVTELYNLRYLDLSHTKVKHVPASLRKLTNLQVLDLRFSYVEELPLEITMLTNLRHLHVCVVHDVQERSLNCFSATEIPGNISGLKNLQALMTVSANKDLVSQLENLTLLRSLAIMKVRQSYIAELWNSLTKMPNLGRLLLFASDKNDILDLRTLRPLPNIKLLWLAGKLEGGMLPPMFAEFEKVTQLKMDWSDLKKDPISSFSHMVNLVDLWLFGSYNGKWLTFSTGWFPKLKFLQLADMEHLNHIQIEDGTMMSLQTLGLAGLRNLKVVPEGIKYIRTLHRMFLVDMSNEFTERMRGSENHIVQHIPNIHCFDSSDSQAGNFHSHL